MRLSKDNQMGRPKASSSKWTAAWAQLFNLQIYYLLRLHRSGAVRQEIGERVGLDGNPKTKQKKHKIILSTAMNSLCNEHSGGNNNHGDGSDVVRWPCKKRKASETLHQMS